MNFIQRHEWVHLLFVYTLQFHAGMMADEPDWDELLNEHFYLCRIEEVLGIEEDR